MSPSKFERERLTNLRYADDLILFCKNLPEADEMLQLLVTELGKVGLELNTSKTKMLMTHDVPEQSRKISMPVGEVELIGEVRDDYGGPT